MCKRGYKRPHLRCFVCKERRWYTYDLDRSQYVKSRNLIIPKRGKFYILFINKHRKFNKLKNILIQPFLTICEFLAN